MTQLNQTSGASQELCGQSEHFTSDDASSISLLGNECGKSDEIPAFLLQRGIPEVFFKDDRRFIAVERSGPPETAHEHLSFWMGRLLAAGPAGGETTWGPKLWDRLALNVPLELTKRLLKLKALDEDTARAAQSALIGTFNSSMEEADLEAAVYALSTFLNAHPSFSHLATASDFVEPFGDLTTYELVTIGTREG